MTSLVYLWRLEWIFWREVDVQEEDSSLVDRTWGAQNSGDPLVDVVALRTSAENKKYNFILTNSYSVFQIKPKTALKIAVGVEL